MMKAWICVGIALSTASLSLVFSNSQGMFPQIEYSMIQTRQENIAQQLQMLKWKENLPDSNIFDSFDEKFKQGKYKPVLAEENVFAGFDKDESRHPWPAQKPEDNVFADTPDKYPFNEIRGGHTWKKWQGSSAMQALDEHNVLDNHEESQIYELGDHTLGRPFRTFEPERNVLGDMDDAPHKWGRTAASIPGVAGTGERNVLSFLSPDSGYGR